MTENKLSIIKSILILVIVVLLALVAALNVADYLSYKNYSPVIARPTVTPTPMSIIDTSDWKTYTNEKYKILMYYPSNWRIIDFQSETNMGTLDTFGFIPINLKNSYCDLEADTSKLLQNYEKYNPFPGYKEYAQTYAKVEFCSIQVRAEKNPEKLAIKDYLKKVYAPSAIISDKVQVEGKIDTLNEINTGKIEQTSSNYAFTKFWGGIDGSYLETSIDENKNQVIINTGNYIIFITNQINQPMNSQTTNNLFEKITSNFQTLP